MKKILIIGGAGFIGAHLARALSGSGDQVDILDNFSRGVRDPFLDEITLRTGVRVVDADMLDPASLAALGDDYNVIYQLAAIVGVRHVMERPYEVLHQNVLIQANAIELTRRQKTLERLVFSSTSEVYAGSLLHLNMPIPTPENVPLALPDLAHARSSYLLSKVYGEAMCQHSGLPFTIVRPHNIYGPRMGLAHVVPELMMKAYSLPRGGRLAVASVKHRRAFCFIDDAVEMLHRLAVAPEAIGGTFNLGNQEEERTIGDVARTILRAVDRADLEIVPLPETAGSPARRCPDMSRTIAVTGFRPKVDLEEGASRTFDWYFKNVFSNRGISAT